MDVMFSYGSLFPFARYTLATSFLSKRNLPSLFRRSLTPPSLTVPTACFVAIGMIANFTIFPETLNSSYTTDLVDKFLIPVLQRSHLHSNLLATSPPTKEGGSVEWEALGTQFDETQRAISAGLEGLLGSTAMLELEVSYGRLGAKDLKEMGGRLREVLARSMGLGVLLRTVQRQHRVSFEEGREGPIRRCSSRSHSTAPIWNRSPRISYDSSHPHHFHPRTNDLHPPSNSSHGPPPHQSRRRRTGVQPLPRGPPSPLFFLLCPTQDSDG